MMELFNSKERDRDDWADLIARADSHFVLRSIQRPAGSILSFLDLTWEGSSAVMSGDKAND